MAGQAIEYHSGQGHAHNFTVCHPHLNAQDIPAEPIEEARRAIWDGVGTPEILIKEGYRRGTRLRLHQLSSIFREAELSASIVHQLSQPLTSMLANAQAATRWLAAEPPNLMEAAASVERIGRDARPRCSSNDRADSRPLQTRAFRQEGSKRPGHDELCRSSRSRGSQKT